MHYIFLMIISNLTRIWLCTSVHKYWVLVNLYLKYFHNYILFWKCKIHLTKMLLSVKRRKLERIILTWYLTTKNNDSWDSIENFKLNQEKMIINGVMALARFTTERKHVFGKRYFDFCCQNGKECTFYIITRGIKNKSLLVQTKIFQITSNNSTDQSNSQNMVRSSFI